MFSPIDWLAFILTIAILCRIFYSKSQTEGQHVQTSDW